MEFVKKPYRETDREDILIDNEKVGRIWRTKHGFQCQFSEITRRLCTLDGIGQTKQDAILDAIDGARQDIESLRTSISVLEKQLNPQVMPRKEEVAAVIVALNNAAIRG